MVVGGSRQGTLDLGFVLLGTCQQGVPILFAVSFVFYGIDTFILFSYYRLNGGYVNDPRIKQRPNIPPKVNQTSEVIAPPEYPNDGFEKE
ncbi:unnamed protein product [Schistosoma margrebowiei]|uniref:Uncharacterized protein n=1 Tax=Schistosoma margrebowiei TaxID=48269 RepID=A0A183MHV4_9TREM|nr:unnamed protein product [Schistosoma margrebowiei]